MSLSGFPDKTKRPTIAVGINYYRIHQGLDLLLSSVHRHTDRQFIIHGKYKTFVYDDPGSLERGREVCKKYKKAEIHDMVDATEIEKRNKYMQLATDYDFLIVLDPDEFIPPQIVNWRAFKRNLYNAVFIAPKARIFDIINEGSVAEYTARPRIFYRPATIRYWSKHYWFIITDENNRLLKGCSDSGHVVDGIVMVHDHRLNDAIYFEARQDYENWIKYNEIAVHSERTVPAELIPENTL